MYIVTFTQTDDQDLLDNRPFYSCVLSDLAHEREAGGDLALIQTSLLSSHKLIKVTS